MKDLFNIIKKPRLTEKSMDIQESDNQIAFKVDPGANKIEIKNAVEKLFSVKVAKVRTANMHGKKKRLGKYSGRTANWKKAVVTLDEGYTLNFLEDL